MTYWARLDGAGPWLEAELMVGSTSFELRPHAPAARSTTIPYDAVARVEEPHPVPAPGERTIEVVTVDGAIVSVRGPATGIAALQTSLQHATAAPGPERVGDTSRRSTAVLAGIVAVVVVLIALWTYHADQGELAAKARARRAVATSTTTTTEPTMPDARVEGATTVPTTPAPPAGPTSTTTTAPVTSSTVAGRGAATTSVPATSVAPTTAPRASTPGPLRTIVGTVTVRQAQRTDGGTAPVCGGVGALGDITTGATVSVRDSSGRTVATGTLGPCRFVAPDAAGIPGGPPASSVGTPSVLPQFDVVIPNVPDSDSYGLQVLHYDPVGFTKAQLGNRSVWRVSVAITI